MMYLSPDSMCGVTVSLLDHLLSLIYIVFSYLNLNF